jgi:GNAT superfamily N-acetyltransferase
MQDNDELQALQAQCPMGTNLVFSTVNTPDFFARARAYADYQVFVACRGERIIASAACATRDALVGGRACRVGYEFQYFSSPAHRNQGAARLLHQHIEAHLRQHDVALSYLITSGDNLPAQKLFEGQGFGRHRDLFIPNLLIYKNMDLPGAGTISPLEPQDLAPVAALLDETWRGHDLYAPTSAQALEQYIQRIPAYDQDNLLLLRQGGEIVACLGYWDWNKITQVTVKSLNLQLRLLGWALGVIRRLRPMPRMVWPGQTMKQWALTPIAFKQPRHLAALLRRVNNLALQRSVEQLTFIGEKDHAMFQSIQGFFKADVQACLYVKTLDPGVSLSDAPVYIDGIDL